VKIAHAAAVAVIALAPISVLAPPVGHADPDHSPGCPTDHWAGAMNLCWPAHFPPNEVQCNVAAAQAHQDLMTTLRQCDGAVDPIGPTTVPAIAPSQTTQAPSAEPVQAPNPPPTHGPATRPATVRPPTHLDASPDAIAAARGAQGTRIDPANPPPSPTQADFNKRVQNVIKTRNSHVDVVNGLAHPRHWDYIDYDQNHHPVLYNPINQAMTFRYFYAGSYREVYVAASDKVVLNFVANGSFPFTAVGDDYLTTGSFYSGSPPAVYQDVAAYIPAYGQTVQVGKVQPMGRDDSQPAGGQDTFMLDDSTLAWGQATNPADGGQITVTKTQTLPGVGPTDDGKSLIDLTAASQPQTGLAGKNRLVVFAGVAAALAVLAAGGWLTTRRKGRTAGGW
jgi:hypothetical protein